MMRRYGLVVLFFVVLLVPVVLRRFMVHAQPAPRSGLRLVIITPDNQDIRREFARAFDRWHREKYHTGVTIDYRTPGGTNDIERQLRSTYAVYRGRDGNLPADVPADIDILFGGGDYSFNQLKTAGLLQPMHLDPSLLHAVYPAPALAGVRLYDNNINANGAPAPRWVGACLSGFGIIYNPDLYESLQLSPPTTWHDLTNPRLKGFIGLADPSHSGSVGAAMMMVLQRAMADAEQELFTREPRFAAMAPAERKKNPEYQSAIARGWKRGMCDLTLIAANARYFTDSAETVPTDVSRGEAAAGMAIDFYAHVTEAVVGPARARFVLPAHATAITPDPVAVLTGVKGERLELAMHFVEFVLSKQGQLLWALPVGAPNGPTVRALSRPPIRLDVYADRQGWKSLGDPFTEAGNFNQRGEWMALFTDCQMIWVAAWIDSRDAMMKAYARALSAPDPSVRATLLERFSDLPIEMSDVAAMNAQRTAQPPEALDLWRARERIRWAQRFRDHYQSPEGQR